MMPTAWSVLFDNHHFPADVTRRLRESDTIERMSRELRGLGDRSFVQSAEHTVEETLQRALDLPLDQILISAWRQHPDLASARAGIPGPDGTALLHLDEHRIVSTHRPRVDVVGPKGTVSSLEVELRLELSLQSVTLRLEGGGRLSRATVGACSATAALTLDGNDLATSERPDVRFPDEISLESIDLPLIGE